MSFVMLQMVQTIDQKKKTCDKFPFFEARLKDKINVYEKEKLQSRRTCQSHLQESKCTSNGVIFVTNKETLQERKNLLKGSFIGATEHTSQSVKHNNCTKVT